MSSSAAASLRATDGDRFCGNVFDLARNVINVVVVFVVGVVDVAPVAAAVAVDGDVVAVARPRSTLGNGTASIFVRERDFISFIGVEVFVCMRLISESSSSSLLAAQPATPATAVDVDVDVDDV